MIFQQTTSDTAENLKQIIHQLQKRSEIEMAILSTEDGIPVQYIHEHDSKTAAVAGFILAATRQGFAMLNLNTSQEVVIRNSNGQLFVSRIFQAGESRLILTVLFGQEISYKRLLTQAINKITTAVEK